MIKMKFYRFLFFVSLIAVIDSCTPKKNYIIKVKITKLTESTMYDRNLVSDYLFDAEESPVDSLKNKSKLLFLKGIDLYKNKKHPNLAVPLFKKSILLFPDAKTYYELANALLDGQAENKVGNGYDEYLLTLALKQADSALDVAKHLKFTPEFQLCYDRACVANMLYNADTTNNPNSRLYDLEEAFSKGFNDTTFLKNDKRINSVIKTKRYKEIVADWLASKSKINSNSMFSIYIRSFPAVTQPFEIVPEKVNMDDYSESISYDYVKFIPEMGNTEFGRNVQTDYQYVAKVAETRKYVVVIYSASSFYGLDWQPTYTKLVSYDTAGNIISTRLFACQFNTEKIRTGKIDNNQITLKDLKRIWQYPIDSVRFEDNKVLRYELLAQATFHLNDSGRIVKDNAPVNFNDSAKLATH